MRVGDVIRYGLSNVTASPLRALLLLLAMSIGVAAVVMLSTLGEAARLYVINQFSTLGTHLLIVLPGRAETTGGAPPLLAAVPRDLTLDDATALLRSPSVRHVSPIVVGSAPVSYRGLEREATIIGTNADQAQIRDIAISQGHFLPNTDIKRGAAICVIGETIRQELFGSARALGQSVRINSYRYRVIGVLADKGESLGMNMGDAVYVPVASAQTLFNTESLFRIMLQATRRETIAAAKTDAIEILRERHDGEDDVTVITQDAILGTFDRILKALTYTVVGIAAISLAVAGVLIMNVMLVAVSQRTTEIGLLKALGGSKRQILILFLSEAALLSIIGALCGILISWAGVAALDRLFPAFPLSTPAWAYMSALIVAIATSLIFGIMPARRAAHLDPIDALMKH